MVRRYAISLTKRATRLHPSCTLVACAGCAARANCSSTRVIPRAQEARSIALTEARGPSSQAQGGPPVATRRSWMMAKRKLLYRTAHNRGLVFATPERALLIDRIHRGIETSTTWEQFRKAMPPNEYSQIIRSYDEQGEPRPRGLDEVQQFLVPGYCDGDYPAWLQSEMDWIADDLWPQFGTLENTIFNGAYWHIPESKRKAVCAALRLRGWE